MQIAVDDRREIRFFPVTGERRSGTGFEKRPAAGEVKANTARILAYANPDLEELGAQSFDLRRAPGLGKC